MGRRRQAFSPPSLSRQAATPIPHSGEEYRDSSVLARGEALSSQDLSAPNPDGDTGVLYRVRIDQSFKGKPSKVITYYSARNSSGFYLDVGNQYLLFLNPPPSAGWITDAPGAMIVNYNCGQSRKWDEVPAGDRRSLNALAAKAR